MKKIPLILAAVALLAACEKQVDIDLDAQQSKVVVSAVGEADSTFHLRLTYSRPVFSTFYVADGESYFKEIDNATLTFVANGTAYGATNVGGDYTVNYVPQAGDRLTLTVKVPGRDDVTAEATVPNKPAASDFSVESYQDESDIDIDYWNDKLTFKLHDDGSTTDYYSLRVLRVDTSLYYLVDNEGNICDRDSLIEEYYLGFSCTDYMVVSNADISIDDPTAANTYQGREMLFTDANINGMTHEFVLDELPRPSDHYYGDVYVDENHHAEYTLNTTYYLVVSALSRDMYLYRQTLSAYSDD